MSKKIFPFFLYLLFILLSFSSFLFADESITITTYYPSPYGSYNQLYVADKLNIGTTTPYARLNVETDGSAASPGAYPSAPLGYFLSWAGDGPTTDTGVPLFAIAAGRIWTTDTYAANARLFQVSTDNGVQFIIRGTGNVGIGTTSPGAKLDIYEPATTNPQNSVLKLEGYADAVNEGPFIDFHERWAGSWPNWITGRIGSVYETSSGGSNRGALVFYTNNSNDAQQGIAGTSEKMRIDGAGNVGIGTTNPSTLLNIRIPTYGNMFTLQADGTTADAYSQMRFIAGNRNAYIWLRNQAVGGGEGDGALSIYSESGSLNFWSAAVRRMVIDTSGNVGIGTTNPAIIFQVRTGADRRIGFTDGISVSGAVVLEAVNDARTVNIPLELRASNVYLYGTLIHASDVSLKQNIKNIDDALEKVSKINGVTFKWKDKNRDQGEQMGVIAQDVEKAAPQLIKEYKDGTKGVNYDGLNALTIEAIKELNNNITKLAQENQGLKSELENLKTRLSRLEAKSN